MSFRLTPLLAAGALIGSSGVALAQTATATADVFVRAGPGTQYEVLDKLPAGEVVNILDCSGLWCEISMGGDSGFVSRNHLDDGARRSRVRAYEREDLDDFGSDQVAIERDDPYAIGGLAIGGYYESRPFYIREGYYYWGGRWYHRRPGAPGWRNGSWRRWEDRRNGPGDIRDGRTNRPPRFDDRRARIDRDGPGDTREGRTNRPPRIDGDEVPRGRDGDGRGPGVVEGREGAGNGDRFRERSGERSTGTVDRPRGERPEQRAGRPEPRTGGLEPRPPSDGGGRTPNGPSSDRGDRVGLDRAGGGDGRRDR